MEKNMEQKILSTMELIVEKVNEGNVKLDILKLRFDALESRIDALEVRIDEVERSLNARIDEVEMVLREEMKMIYHTACDNKEKIETLLFPYQDKAISVVNEVTKISPMEEREEMIIETIREHSEAIRNIQDYLHIGNKPAKKKLHIF